MARNFTNSILLARVPRLPEAVRKHCAKREGQFPYFNDMRSGPYVSLDLGRHTVFTDEIRAATTGYALADARGNVKASYRSLANAEAARQKAEDIAFEPEFEMEADESSPENPRADGSYGYPQGDSVSAF